MTDYPEGGGNSHTEFTVYEYDENNLLSTEQHGYGNAVEETRIIRSGSTTLTDNVYTQMRNDHVVALPIETQVWRGSQLVSAERTTYKKLAVNHYVPAAQYNAPVDLGTTSVSFGEADTVYDSYDSMGNPLVVFSRDGTPSTWYWSKDSKYPVAFFQNACSGEQISPTKDNTLTTETSVYSSSPATTIIFESESSGPFSLQFTNASTGGVDISATLDNVDLNVVKFTDIQGVKHFSYESTMNNPLPAGSHSLIIRGIPTQFPMNMPMASPQPFSVPFSGTLVIRYVIKHTVLNVVDEENVVFEDFETSGGVADIGFEMTRGRTSTYNKTVQINPYRNYILDWMRKTGNVWEYRHEVMSSSTGSLTLSIPASSANPIDNIRFYPEDANATNWTWKGNMGIGSVTDSRGITEYYSYDNYGRLESVRDNDKAQVQGYSYMYSPYNAGGSKIWSYFYTSSAGDYN